MHKLIIYILTISIFLPGFIFGQSAEPKEEIHKEVLDALDLHGAENTEGAIKKCLQILSSKKNLTKVDSTHLAKILANNLFKIGDFKSALNYAEMSETLKFNSQDAPNYLRLLRYYNAAEEYEASLFYMKQTLSHHIATTNELEVEFLARTCNDIGFTHYLNKQKDSAEFYYLKVINLDGIEETHSEYYGLSIGNLGNLYFEKGEYQKALDNFKIDAQLTKGKIWESFNNATSGKAECYIKLKDYRKAEKELLILFSQKRHATNNLKESYRLMAEVCEHLNKAGECAKWLKKYVTLIDSLEEENSPKKELINQLSQSRVNLIQKDLKIAEDIVQLQENELIISSSKEKAQQFRTRIFIVISILSLLVILIVFVNYRVRQKKNQAINQLRNELLENELETKKKDLNNVVTNLTYKRKFIDEVQHKLKDLQKGSEETLMQNITSLIREFNNYKSADKSMEVLQADIDKVNLSFFNELGAKFPDLSENEKEMCGFFVLNLSSKDIAIIRNVSSEAVKKARHRIRKKLPISTEENITTFLNNI